MLCLKRTSLIALVSVALWSCSSALQVKTRVLMPAETNLGEYKTVAVADFQETNGDWGRKIASWLEDELSKAKVDGKPYFILISRTKLERMLEENNLPTADLVGPTMVSQLARLGGVDAIITGTVNQANNQELMYSLRQPCALITGHLNLIFEFISVRTGRVEFRKNINQQKVVDSCGIGGQPLVEYAYNQEPLSSLVKESIREFVRQITPHYSTLKLSLKTRDDSLSGSSKRINKLLSAGNKYAEHRDWDRALEQFQQAVTVNHDSPAANYNLAVILEVKGNLHEAKEHYETAARLKPDPVYTRAVSHINQLIASQEKVKEQLFEQSQSPKT
jgi:tetratricopeptide (TPR) repeat protein